MNLKRRPFTLHPSFQTTSISVTILPSVFLVLLFFIFFYFVIVSFISHLYFLLPFSHFYFFSLSLFLLFILPFVFFISVSFCVFPLFHFGAFGYAIAFRPPFWSLSSTLQFYCTPRLKLVAAPRYTARRSNFSRWTAIIDVHGVHVPVLELI